MSEQLGRAISEMGRAVHCLRLEVPGSVADDVAARWRAPLDAIEAELDRPTLAIVEEADDG